MDTEKEFELLLAKTMIADLRQDLRSCRAQCDLCYLMGGALFIGMLVLILR